MTRQEADEGWEDIEITDGYFKAMEGLTLFEAQSRLRLLRAQQRKIVDGKEYRRWKKFEPIQEGHNGQD